MTMSRHDTKASFETRVAPHVDPRWAEQFIIELRLGGVAGTEIGAALAEVESYCAESGDEARDAFGPARDDARALDLETSAAQSPRRILAGALPVLIQLVGMMAVVWSAPALARGEDLAVTAGMAINAAALTIGLGVMSRWPQPILRLIAFRPWIAWVVVMVAMAVIVVPVVTIRVPMFTVAAAAALGGGVVVILAGLTGDVVQTRRASAQDGQDVLAAPLEGPGTVERRSRHGRWLTGARMMLIPAGTVVLGVVGVLLA